MRVCKLQSISQKICNKYLTQLNFFLGHFSVQVMKSSIKDNCQSSKCKLCTGTSFCMPIAFFDAVMSCQRLLCRGNNPAFKAVCNCIILTQCHSSLGKVKIVCRWPCSLNWWWSLHNYHCQLWSHKLCRSHKEILIWITVAEVCTFSLRIFPRCRYECLASIMKKSDTGDYSVVWYFSHKEYSQPYMLILDSFLLYSYSDILSAKLAPILQDDVKVLRYIL